jgi:hypothetical protein
MTVTIAPAIARTTHDIGDFSFLQGAWRATERFLTKCGVGSDEWQVREAYLILRPLLGGMANAEEITYPGNPGLAVATFRCYEIASDEWIIQSYVYGGRPDVPGMLGASGILIPPLRGRLCGGRGNFFGETEYEGSPVRVRYVWRDITAISAIWERWFSFDDGQSWELNITWTLIRERTL